MRSDSVAEAAEAVVRWRSLERKGVDEVFSLILLGLAARV